MESSKEESPQETSLESGQPPLTTAKANSSATSQSRSRTDVPGPALIHGAPFYIMVISILMALVLMSLGATMLGTAIPAITDEFHTVEDVGWYAAAYLISQCGLAPLAGALYRMFHLKTVFLAFVSLFGIGSLVTATATSSTALVLGRTISGLGAAGIVTGSTTIIAATVPLSRRTFVIGICMGCISLGQVCGPLIGGVFVTYVSWRWSFYLTVILSGLVVAFFGLLVRLPVTYLVKSDLSFFQKIMSIDLIGFFIFVAACVSLLLGFEYGGQRSYGWNSPITIACLCVGSVGLIVLVGWFAFKGDRALIPPRVLGNRINMAIGLTTFLQGGGVFLGTYWLPVWFQGVKEASAMASGVMVLPTIVSQFIASVACGALVQKTGYYLPEVVVGNAMVAAGATLMTMMTPDTTEGMWIGFQILVGAGRGLVMQLLVTAIQTNLPPEDASLGASFVTFAQYFSGAIFLAVAETVFTSSLGPALQEHAPGVNPAAVIDAGFTNFKNSVPASELPGVLQAYNDSINHVFIIQLACSAAALLSGLFVGWRKVTSKKG
ncbi:MFS general substrate transporter [Thozetella sp. PMI_491]|nr:MFS general substrate transporter [Thozetella sp. PMI_491]